MNSETTNKFSSVHFPSASTGYVITGWPSDAGIYKTSDAGNSWSFQDPGTTQSLNAIFFADENIGYIGFATLKVYDMLGKEATTLVAHKLAGGHYQVKWDAGGLVSGVYHCRLQYKKDVEIKKLMLRK